MIRRPIVICASLLFALAALSIGCSDTAKKPGKADAAKGSAAKDGAAAQDGAAAESEDAKEIREAMAKLPDADRKLAEAQGVCPVGDGPLGAMGMPYKVTVKGRVVFLCCDGCKAKIEADPDTYLAKIDEKKAK